MQAETRTIAYFGKVPTHGDFVRRNAGGEAVRAMDTWLQQGLYLARSLPGFEAAYDAAGPYPFHFLPRDAAQGLIGVMCPSHDSVGRTYPFLVAVEADAGTLDSRSLRQVPAAYEAFFARAAAVAQAAASGQINHTDLADHTDALYTTLDGGGRTATFEAYLQETELSSLWTHFWGHPGDSRKYLLFKNLLDILLPLRSGLPAGFPLALRFPLGAGGEHHALEAGFWLDVCMRLLGDLDLQPTFFWLEPGEAGGADPFFLLTLRPPPARTFTYLWPADADGDTLCDLERLGGQSAAIAALSIPARYGELLEADHLSLAAFLQRL